MASSADITGGGGSNEDAQFEPRIVAFCCNFCAYAAADLAGSMRLNYPANAKVIRLPCSGKVEIVYLLRAIEDGADGVMVIGCLEGDCHFINGNFRAKKRVAAARKLIEKAGIEPERIGMYNLSSAMAGKFAEAVKDMTEKVKKLGPSPIRKGVTK
jgi:coenzyme F420-reducing hydrogenase delta subunit